jgi:hypothetical protein
MATYDSATISAALAKLREAPPPRKGRVSAVATALQTHIPEIKKLRADGYSFAAISSALKSAAIPASAEAIRRIVGGPVRPRRVRRGPGSIPEHV